MGRRIVLFWLIGGLSVGALSCYHADRSNPLDGHTAQLFVPQIIQPHGGEQWFARTTHQILWERAIQVSDSVVTLQLVFGGTSTPPRVIANHVPNTGQFSWVVPDLDSPACRIRVVTSNGQAESEGPFRISPPPELHQLVIGGEGREPAALREYIVFTSNRSGNDDLWMINRLTGALTQLTNASGFDGQADWFKPNGNLLAFTSDRSGQNDIWVIDISQSPPHPVRITTTGGEQPTWQPSFLQYPSLAYVTADQDQPGYSQILAVTIGIPTALIVPLPDPVPLFAPVRLTRTRFSPSSRFNISRPAWGLPGGTNAILYEVNSFAGPVLWRLDFTTIATESVSSSRFTVPPGLPARHPALSLSGARVAFSALGDIWVMPLNGGPVPEALQVTYGDADDDYPDWASETTIVFQRQQTPTSPWELWTVEVPQ